MKQVRWLTAAVSDDSLVAELLLRLKDSATAAGDSIVGKSPLLPAWGARQPRSSAEKKRDARRRSPTTPLSWSAASPSDCYDDSLVDRPQPFDLSRSKTFAELLEDYSRLNEPIHLNKTFAELLEDYSRLNEPIHLNKTFAELLEDYSRLNEPIHLNKTFAELLEDSSRLNERIHLNKELATLRFTVVDQVSMNDSLKRRKLDFPLESSTNTEENSEPNNDLYTEENGTSEATSKNASRHVKQEETSEEPNSSEQRGVAFQEPVFVLPDLNMSPDEGIVGMLS